MGNWALLSKMMMVRFWNRKEELESRLTSREESNDEDGETSDDE